MTILLQGAILGFSLSLLLGPIFFLFLDATAVKGMRGGFLIGLGAWCSDIMYLTSAFFAYSLLLELTKNQGFEYHVGLLGGILLIIIGISTMLNKDNKGSRPGRKNSLASHSDFRLWLRGFLVNTFNPFCAIFWVGAVSSLMISKNNSPGDFVYFGIGSVGTIILFDLVKILAAKKILNILSDKVKTRVKQIAGLIILVFGLVLIFKVM